MKLIHPRHLFLFCIPFLVASLCTSAASSVIRVKWDSGVNGPGNGWGNAYRTVAAALVAAQAGDEVWVAGDSAHSYFERITLKNGVGLYGGFAGTETAREQRSCKVNVTILDGSQAGNVVTSAAGDTAATVLDGFTIRNAGSAYRGIWCSSSCTVRNNTIIGIAKGGVTCDIGSSPTVTDNTITGNLQYGIYANTNSTPWIANNTISATDGSMPTAVPSGVYCATSSFPTIVDNTIQDNDGYGIHCNACSPLIRGNAICNNSLSNIYCRTSASPSIVNNTITDGGHGVDCEGEGSSPDIINNVLIRSSINCFYASPAIMYNTICGGYYEGITLAGSASPHIIGNVVAYNRRGGLRASDLTGTPVLSNNCVYNPGGTEYYGLSAGSGDISVDPLFVSRAANDYHLSALSPCIGAGLNSAVSTGAVDMDGEPRILPPGSNVDIGADEFTYTIGDAKALAPDDAPVYFSVRSPVAATASFPGAQPFYYVEHLNRTSGIRCLGTSPLSTGQTGVLQAVMDTVNGERVLKQVSVLNGTLGTAEAPKPLFMVNHSLGGASRGLQSGLLDSWHLNNIGLLVQSVGRVEFVDPSRQYMTVSDGSAVCDEDGHTGIRVWAPGLIPSALTEGDMVTVKGISSCSLSGGVLYSKVLVRTADDIVRYAQ